jgi:hypothetical protein
MLKRDGCWLVQSVKPARGPPCARFGPWSRAQAKLQDARRFEELADRRQRITAQTPAVVGEWIADRLVSLADSGARPIRDASSASPTSSAMSRFPVTPVPRRGDPSRCSPTAAGRTTTFRLRSDARGTLARLARWWAGRVVTAGWLLWPMTRPMFGLAQACASLLGTLSELRYLTQSTRPFRFAVAS